MKRLNLLLVAFLLIASGVCNVLGWNIAAYILLGGFLGGTVSEFIMPLWVKRLFPPQEEPVSFPQENNKNDILERMTIKTGQKIDIIDIKDIVFFAANGDYVSIYTEKNVWLKEMTMKDLERVLPIETFVRVHRSYIVNVGFIRAIDRYKKGQYIISLSNRETIKMTDSGYAILKQRLSL